MVAHRTCEDDSDCVSPVGGSRESPDPAAAAAAREVAAAAMLGAIADEPRAQCLRPVMADTAERLVRLRVAGQPTVLYLGHPINLLTTGPCVCGAAIVLGYAQGSSCVAGHSGSAGLEAPEQLAAGLLAPGARAAAQVRMPVCLSHLKLGLLMCGLGGWGGACRYTFSLSSALYLLNMVPAYYLDGQWATLALIELALPRASDTRKAAVARTIMAAGSALFVVSILVSLWAAFRPV